MAALLHFPRRRPSTGSRSSRKRRSRTQPKPCSKLLSTSGRLARKLDQLSFERPAMLALIENLVDRWLAENRNQLVL